MICKNGEFVSLDLCSKLLLHRLLLIHLANTFRVQSYVKHKVLNKSKPKFMKTCARKCNGTNELELSSP